MVSEGGKREEEEGEEEEEEKGEEVEEEEKEGLQSNRFSSGVTGRKTAMPSMPWWQTGRGNSQSIVTLPWMENNHGTVYSRWVGALMCGLCS